MLSTRLYTLLLLVTPVYSLAPVRHEINPEFWEKVRLQRSHQNTTHNFRPRYIPPEHCLHLSEAECKKADLHRGLQNLETSGNPSVGNFRVLVLLIYFPEDDPTILPGRDHFETLFNGEGVSDINPVGSIRQYLLYNSLGQYEVTFDVQDWAPTTAAASSFATGTDPLTGAPVQSARWSTNGPLQGVFSPVLRSMEESGFDFSPYDSNGDGRFDHLHIIHSGYPAELGAFACTPPAENMIWSQGSPGSGPDTYVTGSGMAVSGYTISSAWTFDVCSNTPTNMAVATHEYIHGFDVRDTYDTDYTESTIGTGGLGAFDTMAFAYGWNADGARPSIMSPFAKMEANWLTPLIINEDGLYAIQPAELSGQVSGLKCLGLPTVM